MNIKDFLIDHYGYIIIVIILTIVTIIGFLADRKTGGTRKSKGAQQPDMNPNGYTPPTGTAPITYNPNSQMVPGMTPNMTQMPTQAINPQMNALNNVPNNQNMNVNSVPEPMNQNLNMNMSMPTAVGNNAPVSLPNAPQPVEPMNQVTNVTPEPMYQPVSEQKPVIAPVDPMQNINTIQPVQDTVMSPQNVANAQAVPTINPVGSVPNMTPNMIPTPEPTPMINQNQVNMPNQGGSIPTPQPVPIPNPVGNTVPSPINPPQPTNPQPVSFVYGAPQNNNNQFM